MRQTVLKRMEQELKGYREYLIAGKLTPEQILDESYQFLVEQKIHCIFKNDNYSRLASKEWDWLSKQKQPLNYLFRLWMENDVDLTEEFAEILHNELASDMEVHHE